MCLGAIGRVRKIWDEGGVPVAEVEANGELNNVCLLYVPEATVGDSVLVHLGFAVELLEPDRAAAALDLRREIGL